MNIPKRIASALINSLKGGVVPRVGLPYITVGRKEEIEALVHDIDIVSQGGASFRFIAGRYGSGKSFLLQTVRNYAMDRGFAVMDCDLSPERRLHGTKGQGLATYRELGRNLSTKTRPDGGALTLILERWISSVQSSVVAQNGVSPQSEGFRELVDREIYRVVGALSELVHGFDFARLLSLYYKAYLDGDDQLKANVIKWFRGEYSSKSEARAELGVNIIITDDDWYDYIKLFSLFLHEAGYSGLLVLIDELVNIYKVPNAITRQYNYEKLLTMYNDALQGRASYMGIIMCGTPQCIEDQRRGLYSYEALRSRLADGRFASDQRDMMAPVIKLSPLTAEEMLVLAEKLEEIHCGLYDHAALLNDKQREDFIKLEYGRVGADQNITPREIIRDFIQLLNVLCQHPGTSSSELIGSGEFTFSPSSAVSDDASAKDEYSEIEI